MNSTEIENKLLELSERMKNLSSSELKADFIYAFMLAYEIPKATVSRIKTGGNVNLSKIEGQIILKNRLWFQSFEDGENLLSKIDELKSTVKHNPRFIMITDYKTIVAFDTKLKDPLGIPFSKLAKHYDFFLPLNKMEKATAHEDNPADRKAAEAMHGFMINY